MQEVVMVKNLRLLREEKGYSQQKLAEMINVSQQAIFKYEKTDNEPDISTLICLAKIILSAIPIYASRSICSYRIIYLNRSLPICDSGVHYRIMSKAVLMCLSQAYTLPINSYKNTAEHFLCGVLLSMFVYL